MQEKLAAGGWSWREKKIQFKKSEQKVVMTTVRGPLIEHRDTKKEGTGREETINRNQGKNFGHKLSEGGAAQ